MIRQIITPFKALRTLRKTPLILAAVLDGVSHEQAAALRDGADGWSILFIVCHLRDLEGQFLQRAQDLLAQPNPIFADVSLDELMRRSPYERQNFDEALEAYFEARRQFVALLEGLSDAQWLLAGEHPTQGPGTMLDIAVNTGLHDVDHIEQIQRCLRA